MLWLDAYTAERFGAPFAALSENRRKEVLDLIAFRENAPEGSPLMPGVQFFDFLRGLTLDGFFTSRAGIDYLGFKGNSALREFPGCPE